jgi:hypothetical protein
MDRVSYVGIITAIAPGRFAAAINQPPVLSYGAILPVDWLASAEPAKHPRAGQDDRSSQVEPGMTVLMYLVSESER